MKKKEVNTQHKKKNNKITEPKFLLVLLSTMRLIELILNRSQEIDLDSISMLYSCSISSRLDKLLYNNVNLFFSSTIAINFSGFFLSYHTKIYFQDHKFTSISFFLYLFYCTILFLLYYKQIN